MIRSPPASNVRSYTSVASCGNSKAALSSIETRKAKDDLMSLSLDFKCQDFPNAPVSDLVIADFIYIELGLRKSEITGVVGGGSGHRSVKIETIKPIDLTERFGDKLDYRRLVAGKDWSCSIRSGKNASPMRFFNVPKWITNEELIMAVAPFAKPMTGVEYEVFGKYHDPRLTGLTNGHRRSMVSTSGTVPDFITIGEKKIRIYHRNQIAKCFLCRQEGHIKASCPTIQEEPVNDSNTCPKKDYLESGRDPSEKEDTSTHNESEDSVVFEEEEPVSVEVSSPNKMREMNYELNSTLNNVVKCHNYKELDDGSEAVDPKNSTINIIPTEGIPSQTKRKTPASQTTPIAKDATNAKKKGRTTREPKSIITRSESAAA